MYPPKNLVIGQLNLAFLFVAATLRLSPSAVKSLCWLTLPWLFVKLGRGETPSGSKKKRDRSMDYDEHKEIQVQE